MWSLWRYVYDIPLAPGSRCGIVVCAIYPAPGAASAGLLLQHLLLPGCCTFDAATLPSCGAAGAAGALSNVAHCSHSLALALHVAGMTSQTIKCGIVSQVVNVRGNVESRLERIRAREMSATVLALAGRVRGDCIH